MPSFPQPTCTLDTTPLDLLEPITTLLNLPDINDLRQTCTTIAAKISQCNCIKPSSLSKNVRIHVHHVDNDLGELVTVTVTGPGWMGSLLQGLTVTRVIQVPVDEGGGTGLDIDDVLRAEEEEEEEIADFSWHGLFECSVLLTGSVTCVFDAGY